MHSASQIKMATKSKKTSTKKISRFPEGKHVDVPEYLRDHGNPEAADEWEDYDGRVHELTASALAYVGIHHPEHRKQVAAIFKAAGYNLQRKAKHR